MEQRESHGDNQQERPSESLAWLAAIAEGEGCFDLSKGKGNTYSPRLTIVNTDVAILDHCAQILKAHEVGFYILTRKRTKQAKPTFELYISGIKRLAKLLPLIQPYVRGKKRRSVDLLLAYIKDRLAHPYYARGFGFNSDKVKTLHQQIRQINQTGILRDYTPSVIRIDDDIVRAAWTHAESQPTNASW